MVSDLRVGLVGLGNRGVVARHAHRPGHGARIVAACDPDHGRWARARSWFGEDVRCVPDIAELLAFDLDAVFIISPDRFHEEQAVSALRVGLAVYLEKPMAITTAGCDRILRAATDSDSRLYVGHNMRLMPFVQRMKRLVDDGAIGEVKVVLCRHFVGNGGSYYFRRSDADRRNTNSLLLQKGAHDIDIMHWLGGGHGRTVQGVGDLMVYGDVVERQTTEGEDAPYWSPEGRASLDTWPPAAVGRLNPIVDVEDVSLLQMRLSNGVLASYQQCHFTPDYWRNYVVIGTEGRIENFGNGEAGTVVRLWNSRKLGWDPDGDATYPAANDDDDAIPGHGVADALMVAEFLAHVREGRPISVTPVDARHAVAVGCAATDSLRGGGSPIAVAEVAPDVAAHFRGVEGSGAASALRPLSTGIKSVEERHLT